ncbi:hypothetical protein BKA58DRAFT_162573 [Alternaria rosae]|uniref:uncharacterized protein n=1 Tax=Alternaria rosae TaxID=1187941 RepID=UPI001E8D0CDC|nr:uncharacterized protein BKA58DRAFT_162573 [Alternaria rosae]KAH6873206.1 hypothetical protein BKA58DRAFT_162573 [Alternaria rosae]
MSFLSNYFIRQRVAPPPIPTDLVIPLHSRDDTEQNRNISIEFTMCFDDVIDEQKLVDALWRLLEKPGWRKLGARLRLNTSNDKLEYHIPTQYTKERPPVNFTHETYNTKLKDHPIGRQFPCADERNDRIQVFDIRESLREITRAKDGTVFLDDWLYDDKAQLGLHVASFKDASLVTLTWLHTLLDAMGRQTLLRAWTAVLEGRDDDVPEFWGYDFDPLEQLGAPLDEDNQDAEGTSTAHAQVQEEAQSQIWMVLSNLKTWLSRLVDPRATFAYLYSQFFRLETMQNGRMLYMPADYMTRLRTEATRDLTSLDASQITYNTTTSSAPKPFLSDGDIFSAWLIRHLVSTNTSLLNSRPVRPIVILNVLGMRDVLSTSSSKYEALIPRGKAYVANCTAGIISPFSVQQFLSMPLGHIAARIRKDLVEQGTREAVEASQRASRSGQQKATPPADAQMAPVVFVFSNWAKAKLFETDFSAAVVSDKDDGDGSTIRPTKGRPTYISVYGNDRRVNGLGKGPGGVGNCVGKDARGGYWFGAISSAREFAEGFEKAVLSDS